jgi:hypothetical protein
MSKGGGDAFPLARTLVAALSLMAGGPQVLPTALIGAPIAVLLLTVSLAAEFRANRARGAMYLTAIAIAPAGVIAASGFEYVYPRHFLVPMVFGYVAIGCQMSGWFQSRRLGRFAVVALLTAYIACNAVPVTRLIANGRSEDAAAFSWVAEHSEGSSTTISGDHDFRVAMPLMYFLFRNEASFKTSGKILHYVERESYPRTGTDWKLLHSSSEWDPAPPTQILDDFQNRYELVKVFPASSLSSFTWWIYRRQ